MSENHSLTGAELRAWRETQSINQDELARLLGVTREWIGKVERGQRTISDRIFLTFERLRREPKFQRKGEPESTHEETDQYFPANQSTERLRAEIRAEIEQTISLAGEDLGKLGWLREQVRRHATAPEHWSIHDKVLRQALEQHRQSDHSRAVQPPAKKSSAS